MLMNSMLLFQRIGGGDFWVTSCVQLSDHGPNEVLNA